MKKSGSLLGGIFLVAGTAIGGGMLALPVLTCYGGFWPTTLLYVLTWAFMGATGHLLMEVTLYFEDEVNIVSMARRTLGSFGQVFAWILYLFLFYSLTIAYIAGGGNLVGYAFGKDLFPSWLPPLLFTLFFSPYVIWGAKVTGRINTLFVWGLIATFLMFVYLGLPNLDLSLLQRGNMYKALLALPIVFTSFAFQGVVPTLTNYLGRDPKRCAIAIWVGSLIPLLVYIIWEAVILGAISFQCLEEAKQLGETAVYPLKDYLKKPILFQAGKLFAFFAIVTSFFGVTLGLTDFLKDGFKRVRKGGRQKEFLAALVFLPPLFFAMQNPTIFLSALHYAGGFGCALLLGLLPVLMAWQGRYVLHFASPYPLPGKKPLLILLVAFVFIELTFTLLSLVS